MQARRQSCSFCFKEEKQHVLKTNNNKNWSSQNKMIPLELASDWTYTVEFCILNYYVKSMFEEFIMLLHVNSFGICQNLHSIKDAKCVWKQTNKQNNEDHMEDWVNKWMDAHYLNMYPLLMCLTEGTKLWQLGTSSSQTELSPWLQYNCLLDYSTSMQVIVESLLHSRKTSR